jgi:hypothetical protein
MNKRILVAVVVLVLASLACGRQLEKWEMTLVNDLTLYVCVMGRTAHALRIGRAL